MNDDFSDDQKESAIATTICYILGFIIFIVAILNDLIGN